MHFQDIYKIAILTGLAIFLAIVLAILESGTVSIFSYYVF